MFREEIKAEQRRIQRLAHLTTIPEEAKDAGKLNKEQRGSSIYCYEHWYQNGKRCRKKYLGTVRSEPVRRYVSNKVRIERLRRLKHDHRLLRKLEKEYLDYDFESIVKDLPPLYQQAAQDDDFNQKYAELKAWAQQDYPKNTAPFPDTENYAQDGTRTRSKGETIFYDLLQHVGILFWYDCVIVITDRNGTRKTLSPDFLIQCFDGTFIIIEHLGRLFDFGYAVDFGEKCYWYLQEGYILGKNFFVTSDDLYGGTDAKAIMQVVRRVERLFYGY